MMKTRTSPIFVFLTAVVAPVLLWATPTVTSLSCIMGAVTHTCTATWAPSTSGQKMGVPPGGTGIYLGTHSWAAGDLQDFIDTVQQPVSFFPENIGLVDYDGSGNPTFDLVAANDWWLDGIIGVIEIWEAIPWPDHVKSGFTVDKLINGDYDTELGNLADELRAFGKPIIVNTAREVNGVGLEYMSGFGTTGTNTLTWALENDLGFNEFDPSGVAKASLFSDLGDATVSDGAERFVAAQRYYYDFFVNDEGLDFLTFDTGGIAAGYEGIEAEVAERIADDPSLDEDHVRALYQSTHDFANLYPGDNYTDWVSINFYMLDYYMADHPGLTEDVFVPNSYYFTALATLQSQIAGVASSKPQFILEFGTPDGKDTDSALAASKLTAALTEITTEYPNIHGIMFWGWNSAESVGFPWDTRILTGSQQGDAMRAFMAANPGLFYSCLYMSNGQPIPTCQ